MALTTDERRYLDELAVELARDNPRLARALAGRWHALRARHGRWLSWRPRQHVQGWLAVVLTAAAMPLLIVGVALDQPVFLALGAAALISGPAVVAIAEARRLWHPPTA
ncbi:MAG TPA: DUF3040 domain-containing protein [Mycobacterium sp.]|nr:DUF3040 domain-containing protein [Mycobacterium sp.]